MGERRLHYISVLESRIACTPGPIWNPLQLAAIHEMRESIMHLIPLSVDQGSVSQWYRRDYKHCINLPPTLQQPQTALQSLPRRIAVTHPQPPPSHTHTHTSLSLPAKTLHFLLLQMQHMHLCLFFMHGVSEIACPYMGFLP